jgi:hypothetical protein
VLALGVCFAVEASQAYHTPGLDALRRTTIGHLVLGSDFDAWDLAAYTLGVLAAVLLEHRWRARGQGGRARAPSGSGATSDARAAGQR